MPLPKEQREYTYADYLNWPDEDRIEIIEGIIYAPATPSVIHQKISMNLSGVLSNYFKDKQCIPFAAPFTVRLPIESGETEEKNNKNIVEPDLVVVCDKSKLDNSGYLGAPTLIIEIVSKSSVKRDKVLKLNKYQQSGVQEYWIIEPEYESIDRNFLNEKGCYDRDTYALSEDEEITSKAFADLTIKLKDIFATWGY